MIALAALLGITAIVCLLVLLDEERKQAARVERQRDRQWQRNLETWGRSDDWGWPR